MNDDLSWSYRRWRAAEADGRDDDADAALRGVFEAVRPEAPVPLGFTAATMAAIATAAERDAVRARRSRTALISGGVVAGVAGAYFGAGYLISALSAGFLRLLNLVIAVIVGAAGGVDAGAGVWSTLSSLGKATAAFAADPRVTVVLLVVQAIAIAALFALQRLLGSNGESFE